MTITGARANRVIIDDPFVVHVPGVVSNREPTYDRPPRGWTCFHCGETFHSVGAAAEHFGAVPSATPGCLIRVQFGDERGLQTQLRAVELERDELQARLNAVRFGVDETETVERFRATRGIV